MNNSMELILNIVDSHSIKGKTKRSHVFRKEGGTIGSKEIQDEKHWFLQDNSEGIDVIHARIIFQDGRFCIEDTSGKTFINAADHSIGKDNIVALTTGDQLRVGKIILHSQLRYPGEKIDVPDYSQLQELISTEDKGDVNQVINATSASLSRHIYDESVLSSRPFDPGTLGLGSPYSTPESSNPQGYADDLKNVTARVEPMLDEEFIDVPNPYQQPESYYTQPFESVALTPLMRGMNNFFSFIDSEQANAFLEEAGRTLESAIKGLLLLEQDRIRINKQMQPVEDNPLRLQMDYVTTLDTMFGERKSQVHLSPSAAVWECLSYIRLQSHASERAVEAALDSVIQSFSPDVLLARFQRYRHDSMTDINDPSWAWEMYKHYFEELRSSRQAGINRLFREVFEQVYDKSLRELREEAKI